MNENRNISMIEGYNKGSIKIKVSEMNKLVQINGKNSLFRQRKINLLI